MLLRFLACYLKVWWPVAFSFGHSDEASKYIKHSDEASMYINHSDVASMYIKHSDEASMYIKHSDVASMYINHSLAGCQRLQDGCVSLVIEIKFNILRIKK